MVIIHEKKIIEENKMKKRREKKAMTKRNDRGETRDGMKNFLKPSIESNDTLLNSAIYHFE